MATLPNLDLTVSTDPDPPASETDTTPISALPDGTTVITTLAWNNLIENVNQIINYISGDNLNGTIDLTSIGDSASNTKIPTPTADYILARNSADTGYEWIDPSTYSGITTINNDTAAVQTLTGGDGIDITNTTPDHSFAVDATVARDTDNLSFFSTTSSSQLLGIISDETGTGQLVFNTSPTIVTPTIVTPTIASFENSNHDHSDSSGGGQLDNNALASGVYSAITGLGTQSQTLDMNNNIILKIQYMTDNSSIPSDQGFIRLGAGQRISWAASDNVNSNELIGEASGGNRFLFNFSDVTQYDFRAGFCDFKGNMLQNASHDHADSEGGGQLSNDALVSGAYASITSIGTLAADLVAGGNDITGIQNARYDTSSITYNSTVSFDFDDDQNQEIVLTGDLTTLTTSNRVAGEVRTKTVKLVAGGSARTVTFNTDWNTSPSGATFVISANATALMTLRCTGADETDIEAEITEFS